MHHINISLVLLALDQFKRLNVHNHKIAHIRCNYLCELVAHCRKYGIYSAFIALEVHEPEMAVTLPLQLRLVNFYHPEKNRSTKDADLSIHKG